MGLAPFVFAGLPTRVVFGAGRRAEAKAEAARLGMKMPLIVTGGHQSALGAELNRELGAGHFDGAKMHTPIEVTNVAVAFFGERAADGVIALGGGSAIGLAKAIALRTDAPQIAIPTTFSGSEMTNILGETADGLKTTKRDQRIQPETVIYDPELTRDMPAMLMATSAMNAIAHGVEALYAVDGSPVISLMAEEGIRAMATALRAKAADDALYGAWLCGAVLGAVSMALHHKLCHTLGGSFNLGHSETHTVILPHAAAYNAAAAPQAMARIARALGAPSAPQGLFDLAASLGAPTALKSIGMPEDGLARAADIAAASPYPNPAPLTREGILRLLNNAYHGHRPTI
jgi:maleylacetate reductase